MGGARFNALGQVCIMRVSQVTFRVVPWYHYLWVFAGLSQMGVSSIVTVVAL